MNAAALNIIRAAFSAAAAIDPAITEERTTNALLALDGMTDRAQVTKADPAAAMFPPIMSPKEVAAVTKLSPRSLRTYAQRGKIRRAFYSTDKKKSVGYVGSSVRAFVESAIGAKVSETEAETKPVAVEVIEN